MLAFSLGRIFQEGDTASGSDTTEPTYTKPTYTAPAPTNFYSTAPEPYYPPPEPTPTPTPEPSPMPTSSENIFTQSPYGPVTTDYPPAPMPPLEPMLPTVQPPPYTPPTYPVPPMPTPDIPPPPQPPQPLPTSSDNIFTPQAVTPAPPAAIIGLSPRGKKIALWGLLAVVGGLTVRHVVKRRQHAR